MAFTQIHNDLFDEANDQELSLHTPNQGAGYTRDANSNLDLLSDSAFIAFSLCRANVSASAAKVAYSIDTVIAETNYKVKATHADKNIASDVTWGLFVNWIDFNNHYGVIWRPDVTTNNIRLYKKDTGTPTQLGIASATFVDGDTIEIEIDGSGNLTVRRNSVDIITATDTALAQTKKAAVGHGDVSGFGTPWDVVGSNKYMIDNLEIWEQPAGTTTPQSLPAVAIGVAVLSSITTFLKTLAVVALGIITLSTITTFFKSLSVVAIASPLLIKKLFKTLITTTIGTVVLTPVKLILQTLTAIATGIATLTPVKLILQVLTAITSGVASLSKISTYIKTLTVSATGNSVLSKTVTFFRSLSSVASAIPIISTVASYFKILTVIGTGIATLSANLILGGIRKVTMAAVAIGKTKGVLTATIAKVFKKKIPGTGIFIEKEP